MTLATVKRNRWYYTLETPEGDYIFVKSSSEIFHNDLQMCCPQCEGATFTEFCGSAICLSCLTATDPNKLSVSKDQSW